jgi:lysozyme
VTARLVPACGLDLIRRWESLHDGDRRTPIVLEPKPDPVGIYSVGYGYALFADGKPVRDREAAYRIWRQRWPAGMIEADAEALLASVSQDVCGRVLRLLPAAPLADHELGALVSLAYNIGVGEVGGAADFADSTVRRKLLAGDRRGAADAFRMWKYAGGRVLAGLVARREAERALFLAA